MELQTITREIERYYQTLRSYPPEMLRARATALMKRLTVHQVQALVLLQPARQARLRARCPLLPGAAALRERDELDERLEGAHRRVREIARGRFTLHDHAVVFTDHIDWNFAGVPAAWRDALQHGDYLLDAAVAGLEEAEGGDLPYTVFRGVVRDWMRGNRPGRGGGWLPHALSRRLANWIHGARLFGPALAADEPFAVRLAASLFRQAQFLERNLERDRADNHVVANGRALFLAGWFFEGEEATRWRTLGTEILWAALRTQVREDGGHCERSPACHALVLGDYLEVLAALRAGGEEIPPWVAKKVRGMADFLRRLLLPDGGLPLMHDAAPGAVRPPADLLATAAVLFREPALRPAGDAPLGVWPHLLLGDEGARTYAHLTPVEEPAASRALRRTGYYVLAGPEGDQMLVDGGGIGAPHLGAHAHNGVFGYELTIGGRRIVVDSGPGGHEGEAWRGYFRGTRAHNTVAVDGAEQSDFLGAGSVAHRAQVGPVRWFVREGLVYFEASHDGYARLAPGLLHTRRIFFLPGRFWLVCDEVRGPDAHDLESLVHFHPEMRIDVAFNRRAAFQVHWPEGTLQVVPFGMASAELTVGSTDGEPRGWYAPAQGVLQEAPVLALRTGGALPLVFGYLLLPRFMGAAQVRCERDAFVLRADVEIDDWVYRFSCVQDEVEMRAEPLTRNAGPPAPPSRA